MSISQQFYITATPLILLESPQIFTTAEAALPSGLTLVLFSLLPKFQDIRTLQVWEFLWHSCQGAW